MLPALIFFVIFFLFLRFVGKFSASFADNSSPYDREKERFKALMRNSKKDYIYYGYKQLYDDALKVIHKTGVRSKPPYWFSEFSFEDTYYEMLVRQEDAFNVLNNYVETARKEIAEEEKRKLREKEERELREYLEKVEQEAKFRSFINGLVKLTPQNGKKPGVYLILNTITNDIYIGSSKNMSYRMNAHKRQMINGNHHSYKMNNSVEEHGVQAFEFYIIKEVPPGKSTIKYEQKYIDKYNPSLNVNEYASGEDWKERNGYRSRTFRYHSSY